MSHNHILILSWKILSDFKVWKRRLNCLIMYQSNSSLPPKRLTWSLLIFFSLLLSYRNLCPVSKWVIGDQEQKSQREGMKKGTFRRTQMQEKGMQCLRGFPWHASREWFGRQRQSRSREREGKRHQEEEVVSSISVEWISISLWNIPHFFHHDRHWTSSASFLASKESSWWDIYKWQTMMNMRRRPIPKYHLTSSSLSVSWTPLTLHLPHLTLFLPLLFQDNRQSFLSASRLCMHFNLLWLSSSVILLERWLDAWLHRRRQWDKNRNPREVFQSEERDWRNCDPSFHSFLQLESQLQRRSQSRSGLQSERRKWERETYYFYCCILLKYSFCSVCLSSWETKDLL